MQHWFPDWEGGKGREREMDREEDDLRHSYYISIVYSQPEKVAQSILLFCKGQGLLTSVTMPGVERQRTFSGGEADETPAHLLRQRTMSMEEYDKPNIRRLSITTIPQKPGE